VTSARQSFRALIYGPPKNKIGKIQKSKTEKQPKNVFFTLLEFRLLRLRAELA